MGRHDEAADLAGMQEGGECGSSKLVKRQACKNNHQSNASAQLKRFGSAMVPQHKKQSGEIFGGVI